MNTVRPHALALAALLAGGPALAEWKAPTRVAMTEERSTFQRIVVDDAGTAHVVWEEGPFLGNNNIYYASRPAGSEWNAPVEISNNQALASRDPDIALGPDGSLHVVYTEGGFDDKEVWYVSNFGSGWSSPIDISNTRLQQSSLPDIEVSDAGNLYVVWRESVNLFNNPVDVYFTEKQGANLWTTPVNVSNGDGDVNALEIELIGDHVFVSYAEIPAFPGREIFYIERPVGGSWTSPFNVSLSASVNSEDVSMDVTTAQDVHLAWEESGRIHYRRRLGGGWGSVEVVGGIDANTPRVFAEPTGSSIHVAYYDWSVGQADIFHSERVSSWSTPVNVSNTPTNAQDFEPYLTWSNGRLYLHWEGNFVFSPFGSDVYESILDGFGGWTTPRSLTLRRMEQGASLSRPALGPDQIIHIAFSGGMFAVDQDVYHLRNDGPVAAPPVNDGLGQNGGSGTVGVPVTLSGNYSDPNGAGSIRRSYMVLNTSLTPVNGLGLAYDWLFNLLVLFSPTGGIQGTCAPGDATTISHSYASLDCAASTVDDYADDDRTINWQVTFTACPPVGCGSLDAAQLVNDVTGIQSGPATVGSWTLNP